MMNINNIYVRCIVCAYDHDFLEDKTYFKVKVRYQIPELKGEERYQSSTILVWLPGIIPEEEHKGVFERLLYSALSIVDETLDRFRKESQIPPIVSLKHE